MLATVTLSVYYILGIAAAAVGLFAAFGTATGKQRLKSLFRGQTIQQLAAVSADQIAAVQSAYAVLTEENKRLAAENVELRARVTVLERVVTAKQEINDLATSIQTLTTIENRNYADIMSAIKAKP
jgi:regulator of replication initiation timing